MTHDRRARLRWADGLALAVVALWIVGQLLRDRYPWSAFLFYIPSPIVALGLAGRAVWNALAGRRGWAIALALTALLPLAATLWLDNRWSSPSRAQPTSRTLRLIHWNVFDGRFGWSGLPSKLLALEPDLIVLSEIPGRFTPDELAAMFGEGFTAHRITQMVVLSRDEVVPHGWKFRDRRGRGYWITWHSAEGPLELIVVDLVSHLGVARDPLLATVLEAVEQSRPDLVVGDFNAPRRSRRLDGLPDGYRHAYDAAGSGWSYTWPVPLPVYAIDQCIFGPRLVAVDYELRSDWRSEHRMQIFDFEVRDEASDRDRGDLLQE